MGSLGNRWPSPLRRTRQAGGAAGAFQVFWGLRREVILGQRNDEFPRPVNITAPAHLDGFWNLEAFRGLLPPAAPEMIKDRAIA